MTKTYTNLEQSKRLAGILPIDTADMAYYFWKDKGNIVNPCPFILDGAEVKEGGVFNYLNCWSLAALLAAIPIEHNLHGYLTENGMVYRVETLYAGNSKNYDNPVDACVELILKLYEQKIL